MDLHVGHGAVLSPSGHNQKLAFPHADAPVPELHTQWALDHQEQLVFVVVLMPDELAEELDQLNNRPFNSPATLEFP